MRTKTLLLSGVVAALSGASIMAQVYSANAVGYVNVSIPGGQFAIVADQLFANGAGQAQYISTAQSTGVLDQLLDGAHNGVEVFKLTNGTFINFIVTPNAVLGQPPFWTGANAQTATLNPGEAAYVYNPFTTNITLTFVGTVPQGTALVNPLPGSTEWPSGGGFSFASSIVPQTGPLDTVFGLTNGVANPGDIVIILDPTTGTFIPSTASLNGSIFTWQPALPTGTPAVGQGFFYYTPTAGGVPNWTRNFTVN